jgi:beta-galactosidase
VLPYSTAQIKGVAHDFELPQSDGVYVNLDLAMSGVGTASCGPELRKEYRASKEGKITFRFELSAQ